MLSRREKLLVEPWRDRRYRDHRSKVSTARAAIDASPPAARPHVRVKAAGERRERERAERLTRDNYRLLQRLAHIMTTRRLDNRWETPLPSFHQKVGRYFDNVPANRTVPARDCRCLSRDCRCLADDSRVWNPSLANAKCYACEYRKLKTQRTFRTASEDD